MFQVSAYDEHNNTAVTLNEAPEVQISYTDSKLQGLGIGESTLTVHYLSKQGWTEAHTTIDPVANTASATLTDMSNLGLVRLVGSRVIYLPLVQR
jgi:Neuraminidase (sialidase)